MIAVLEKYLSRNYYFRIPKGDLKLYLVSHPDYPSLRSITDTLDYFGIDNIAINVPKETLGQLPFAFLALFNQQQTESCVMATKTNDRMLVYFEDGSKRSLSQNEFQETWTGAAIVIEEGKDKKKGFVGNSNLLIFILLSVFIFLHSLSFSFTSSMLSLLSIIGLYLSFLIVNEDLGIQNRTLTKVCRTLSRRSSCSEVIKAAGGKLFLTLALSDLCVIFFSFYFLSSLLLGIDYSFSLCITLLSLPVIAFSLYQQAIVLKKWCALCLGIICVLLLQSTIVLFMTPSFLFSMVYFTKAIFVFILISVIWHQVKPIVVSNFKLVHVEEDFLKFKRNKNLFQTLLRRGEFVNKSRMSAENQIYFGAKNPLVTIEAITNPLCEFCAESFKTYHRLLATHHEKVGINFIFNVLVDGEENEASQIAASVVKIYKENGNMKAWESLQEWFSNRDIKNWQSMYGIARPLTASITQILISHSKWCEGNNIIYSPATVFDGHLYPKEYQISDLLLLIDDIILAKADQQRT